MIKKHCEENIITGKKVPPFPYLVEGWLSSPNHAAAIWSTNTLATLNIVLPTTSNSYYFMAEISSASNTKTDPCTITVKANNESVGQWFIDSPSIHDKLVIIPKKLITQNQLLRLTFEAAPASTATPPGKRLLPNKIFFHSLFIDTNLEAYLNELQTGFNWVCNIRNKLIETTKTVLFFLHNIPQQHDDLKDLLNKIIDDPYVKLAHKNTFEFNYNYFQNHFTILKEGIIHYEIRKWHKELNELLDRIIDAGNYASKHPNFTLTDSEKIKNFTVERFNFDKKISELREKNEKLNNLEILLQKEAITSTPSTLYLDITNTCNFRCKMCYQSKSHFLKINLSNHNMLLVMSTMPFLAHITVAGLGEPLLSKNLAPFITTARNLQCHTHLITNGSLIPNHISTLKFFSKVSISFDAAQAETFETIRHRSNFAQVKKNIQLLRKEAPKLILCFSVVLSRLNIDELTEIFEIGAELHINEISITPIEHTPFLELKKSDKNFFNQEFEKAKEIARKANILINNSIVPESFSATDPSPRNKQQLLKHVKEQPTKQNHSLTIEEITKKLSLQKFQYYPHPIVFPKREWPALEKEEVVTHQDSTQFQHQAPDLNLEEVDLAQELQKLDHMISKLTAELSEKPTDFFTMPFCLDPWKLSYIKSDGTRRLCCHADITTGNLGKHGPRESLNSQEYQDIRRSMFHFDTMLAECKKCKAADRYMGLQNLQNLCKSLGITIKKHSQRDSCA